ncbi:hypothetical protein [Salinimonas lutimaris]|uniref:hypothetical protein n=1 Tax=Salinimonas lutimaris TaxID=914153 RepID=UPI0010BFBA9C|nr:hypothetical protein [Salinimonas lutimaris]
MRFRLRIPAFAILLFVTIFSAIAQAATPVARLFDKPVTEQQLTPSPKALTDMARGMGVSKDMALATMRHTRLAEMIVEAVLKDYAKEQGITAAPALVDRFKQQFAGQTEAGKNLQQIAKEQVWYWQIDKALYEQYQGVVIFSQRNPQFPVSAYLKLLKAYEQQGQFQINDKRYKAIFWRGFEPPYRFEIPPGQVDFSAPWWADSDVIN